MKNESQMFAQVVGGRYAMWHTWFLFVLLHRLHVVHTHILFFVSIVSADLWPRVLCSRGQQFWTNHL
jgi:hypothetical protein